jgi:TPR repeat protein
MRKDFLPPLYFQIRDETPIHENDSCLPSELLQRCFLEYADWGDLAKLACVQQAWSKIMYDACGGSLQSKWELANALEQGTNGLQRHPVMAMQLYLELSNVHMLIEEQTEDDNSQHMPRLQRLDESKECYAPAMKRVALCHMTGTGVSVSDTSTGLAWLEASHLLGHDMDAAHEVALIYEYGTYGVAIDVVVAAEWLEKAANAGHMEAMAELGLCYELGCGVEQSDERALDWYTAAANKGHLTAKFSIAEAYEEARGVPQSDEEACLWYYRAAIEGDEDSRKALRRLEDIARIVVPGVRALLDG